MGTPRNLSFDDTQDMSQETRLILKQLQEQVISLSKQVARLEQRLAERSAGTRYLCEDVAQAVGLKRATLYRKFKRGQIPQGTIWRYAPDGRVIVDVAALEQWFKAAPQV